MLMSVFTQMFLFQSLEDYGQPEAVRVWWCRQKSSLPTIRETMKMTEIITASPSPSEPDRLAIRVQATRSDGSGFECSTSRFVARVSYANCGKTPPGPNLREGLYLAARMPALPSPWYYLIRTTSHGGKVKIPIRFEKKNEKGRQ